MTPHSRVTPRGHNEGALVSLQPCTNALMMSALSRTKKPPTSPRLTACTASMEEHKHGSQPHPTPTSSYPILPTCVLCAVTTLVSSRQSFRWIGSGEEAAVATEWC